MAHGYPDWGIGAPISTVYTVQDMGEAVARLGSPDVHDRRGNVLFMDSFEDGLQKWGSGTHGAASAVTQDNTKARSGGYSCKMYMDAAVGDYCLITHAHPLPRQGRIGIEFAFRLSGSEDFVECWAIWNSGTIYATAGIHYEPWVNLFKYYDENGNWTTFKTDLELDLVYGAFHSLKFVVDLATFKYSRMIVNHEEVDMTALDMYQIPFVFAPCMTITIANEQNGDGADATYVDDVIITRNEP